jgi:hypothetical protein
MIAPAAALPEWNPFTVKKASTPKIPAWKFTLCNMDNHAALL